VDECRNNIAGLQATLREALGKEVQSVDLHGAVRAHEGRHEKPEFVCSKILWRKVK